MVRYLRGNILVLQVSVFIIALYVSAGFCLAENETMLQQKISNGSYYMQHGNKALHYNEDLPFIPASTIKIVTSLLALDTLGPDYRFLTKFYLDKKNNLYIKGFGDPFLTSEAVQEIASRLAALGITQIAKIYLDDSAFFLEHQAVARQLSANPYDAPNGGLCVNFNSVPLVVDEVGNVLSAEPQTPFLPLMNHIGQQLQAGKHRSNINLLEGNAHLTPTLRYVGELFSSIFAQTGIHVKDGFSTRGKADNLSLIYTHNCIKPLKEIIRECLKYSNNFIANQLFLMSGAQVYGWPATWTKSRRLVATYLEKLLGSASSRVTIIEGSGLSMENRISARSLARVLHYFSRYGSLLPQEKNYRIKSGTLTGVYCFAGYFLHGTVPKPFVIMLNQKKNNRQDILNQLLRIFSEKASTSD